MDPVSNSIRDFSKNYLKETAEPFHATLNSRILTMVVPEKIEENLKLGDRFKIYGSTGKGNWSEIPWVALLDKEITKSTEDGYYVVLLFSKELNELYLSLAVGWHQFEWEYGIRDSRTRIRQVCKHYSSLLQTRPTGFEDGPIDLGARNTLGKGYGLGTVFFKKYSVETLSDDILLNDLKKVLSSYKELKGIVGNSILNVEINTPPDDQVLNEFRKKVAAKTLSEHTRESMAELIKEANDAPPKFRIAFKKEIVRNRKFANHVKERAHFICEICGRKPFMQINDKPYAEADHVEPLGGKVRGKDSPDNMRCVCAQCHAILTHGSPEEIDNILKKP